jgi:hypothetical protein
MPMTEVEHPSTMGIKAAAHAGADHWKPRKGEKLIGQGQRSG